MASDRHNDVLSGAVVDEQVEVTLEQMMYYCATGRETVCALVSEGVLQPSGHSEADWRFAGPALHRAAKALRLQRDLDINLNAVVLVLELLDEIQTLRAQIKETADQSDDET